MLQGADEIRHFGSNDDWYVAQKLLKFNSFLCGCKILTWYVYHTYMCHLLQNTTLRHLYHPIKCGMRNRCMCIHCRTRVCGNEYTCTCFSGNNAIFQWHGTYESDLIPIAGYLYLYMVLTYAVISVVIHQGHNIILLFFPDNCYITRAHDRI